MPLHRGDNLEKSVHAEKVFADSRYLEGFPLKENYSAWNVMDWKSFSTSKLRQPQEGWSPNSPLPLSSDTTLILSRHTRLLYISDFFSSSFLHCISWWSNRKNDRSASRPPLVSLLSSPEWISSELVINISSSCGRQRNKPRHTHRCTRPKVTSVWDSGRDGLLKGRCSGRVREMFSDWDLGMLGQEVTLVFDDLSSGRVGFGHLDHPI